MSSPKRFTKTTAAEALGFKSVIQFNKTMIRLGFFNSKKLPASNYEREGYFRTKNEPFRNPTTNILGYRSTVWINQKGLELIREALNQDAMPTPTTLCR